MIAFQICLIGFVVSIPFIIAGSIVWIMEVILGKGD